MLDVYMAWYSRITIGPVYSHLDPPEQYMPCGHIERAFVCFKLYLINYTHCIFLVFCLYFAYMLSLMRDMIMMQKETIYQPYSAVRTSLHYLAILIQIPYPMFLHYSRNVKLIPFNLSYASQTCSSIWTIRSNKLPGSACYSSIG